MGIFNLTAKEAKEIALSTRSIVDYYSKMTEIEDKITKAANNHEFETYVYFSGKDWVVPNEDMKAIRRVLKKNGFRLDYDSHLDYLGISWK